MVKNMKEANMLDISQKSESLQKAAVPVPSARKAYQFFEHIKAEFNKIQWTEGEEVKVYAKIVVFATFALGMSIYIADLVIQKALLGVDVLFRVLFG